VESTDLDILKIIWHAGIVVKLVLLSLIIASIYSWAIILKKKKMVKDIVHNNLDFMDLYNSTTALEEIRERSENMPFSPFKMMFLEGYGEYQKINNGFDSDKEKSKNHFKEFGLGSIERGLQKGVNQSNYHLENLLGTLASIGSISPFVGLFGTVWGIIGSFKGLAGGGATLDAVAPGIAEALVATAVGLLAAIPAVWYYNHYSTENGKINSEMESFGQDFLNTVERTVSQI